MRNQIHFFALKTMVYVFSAIIAFSFCVTTSEAVQIKGKSLGSISDIVKTATGSEFSEIQKHSLLFTERMAKSTPTGYEAYILPHVFTINNDGTLAKEYLVPRITLDEGYSDYTFGSEYFLQNMRPAISDKRFGTRRTVAYVSSGNNNSVIAVPAQTFSFDGSNDIVTAQNVQNQDIERSNPVVWGSAAMSFKGIDKDVFVYLHSPTLSNSGDLILNVIATERNESGSITMKSIYKQSVLTYTGGIRGVNIAAGDFDNDGYKDEFAICFNNNYSVTLYVYKISYSKDGDSLRITGIYGTYTYVLQNNAFHRDDEYYDHYCDRQACVNVITGDFDGDGKEEIATVNRVFPGGRNDNRIRVDVFKYDTSSKSWSEYSELLDSVALGGCKAAKADLDGDGKDELVLLYFVPSAGQDGTYYPIIQRWYCDNGSIMPKCDTRTKTPILGVWFGGNDLNEYYYFTETISITAGPLTGRMGKAKLADDVAISWTDTDRRIYIIPTQLDSDRNFSSFGDSVKIYDQHVPSYVANSRGAVLTADFANEALILDKPSHTFDDHDMSYTVILQAMPYHIDNVDINGNRTENPINYTFSGFEGDEGNGKMKVAYTKESSISNNKDVSFNMASTTETISLLGDAGSFVHGYLKFRTMQANIAGNFDERAKAAAGVMNTIMDFVTDRIDETTTNSTAEADQTTVAETMDALVWDRLLSYSARQHIWRYKILNDPLPSWYKFGLKADNSTKDPHAESKERYISFSIYDTVTPSKTSSDRNNTYQARHEEGNLFSYPSELEEIEGYNSKGELASSPAWVAWTKGGESSTSTRFEKSKIESQKYEDEVHKSELTKTISAIATFFGADDPDPLPPYTSHSETFAKSLSEAEKIDIELYGRSTIPGEEAGHSIRTMPFIAREGTLKVAHAVRLDDSISMRNISRLWGDNSIYRKYADPSLVLPMKFNRDGATLVATNNNASAMRIRGLRFYVPAIDLDSDNNLVAGLTYEIKVPIYNASFKDTGNFSMKLSYAPTSQFDTSTPEKTMNALKEIQTLSNVSLNGWADNKGWAVFTWAVPQDMATGNYIFFVQIDPEDKLDEVHNSRLDYSTGNTIDVGGNNDGYFHFNITSVSDVEKKHNTKAAIMAGSFKPEHSDGILFSSVYRKGQNAVNGSAVRPAVEIEDREGQIKVDLKIEGLESDEENMTFMMLLGLLADAFEMSPDKTVNVECKITYDGDEYYPEAYLNGINLKPGVLDQAEEKDRPLLEDIASNFFVHKMALVPHSTSTFMINLAPREIDWRNGALFEIYVPEISGASVLEEIANSYETEDTKTDADTDTDADDDEKNMNVSDPGSPGGGCAMGFSALALIMLSALIIRKDR